MEAKIEVLKNSGNYDLYVNGVYFSTLTNLQPSYTGPIKYCVGFYCYDPQGWSSWSNSQYIDDLSTSALIGLGEAVTDSDVTFDFTWSALLRGYSDPFNVTLYSITNQDNAGQIKSWNIPSGDNASTDEYGYVSDSRSSVLGSNYGLYMLEMTRGDEILTDQYFYYDAIQDPQGFPEVLFLGESDVNAEITDEDQNGGEIEGGGSVYLYPATNENGSYVIECKILETPYSIRTEFTKIYNNTALTNTTIHYSGLSNQNYLVSLDSSLLGSTTGSDTYDTILIWDSADSHIITFNPDLTLPGIWGYVKSSESQTSIKSASVVISNQNGSQYLYTDSNGMFYLTKGMEVGNYNLSASKTGYTASPSFLVQTEAGNTTRKDIFLDIINGEGTYYATHDVTFTVLEYWYSVAGLPGVQYTVTDEADEITKAGYTDSKGHFVIESMNEGTSYTFELLYNGTNYTEYIQPGLTEYNIVLNKNNIVHQYYNDWLTLFYTEDNGNITIDYESNKTVSEAAVTVTAGNGTAIYSGNSSNLSSSFNMVLPPDGDYIIIFNIETLDGLTASQTWTLSKAPEINLFPASYPAWLKNTLYIAIIIIFLLAFGKSKNDIACLSAAVLTSLGYFFSWLTCSFNFVVLVWIIAIAATVLHYKRTGALG